MSFNFSPKIVTDGLVLYLDAANSKSYTGRGNDWMDLSGGGSNGYLENNPLFSNDNYGSFVFDGTDDYVNNVGTVDDFNFIFSEGTFSVSFWVKKALNNSRYIIAGNTITNAERGWIIILEYGISNFGNNCLRFQVTGNAVNTRLIAGSTNDNTIGTEWTNCVFTCQNPDKVGKWYINGIESITTTRVGTGNADQGDYYSGPSSRTVNIGRSNYTSTVVPFKGEISQFLIYNKSLSSEEVLQNYNTTKSRFKI